MTNKFNYHVHRQVFMMRVHFLNALAEGAIRKLMGFGIELEIENWKYGDPGIDIEKDGVKFDVVYNPDPQGDPARQRVAKLHVRIRINP